jgi:hypothetical protein
MTSGFNVQRVVLLWAGRGQHWFNGRKEEYSKDEIKSKERKGELREKREK